MRNSAHYLLLPFFFLAPWLSPAQQYSESIEALIQELSGDITDEYRAETLAIIASEMRRFDLVKADSFGQGALALAEKISDKKGKMLSLYILGVIARQRGERRKAIEYNLQSLDLALELEEQNHAASNANALGNTYQNLGEYENAVKYFVQALEIYDQTDHIRGKAITNNNLGLVFKNQDKYDQAKAYFLKALDAYREAGLEKQTGYTFMNLGNIEGSDSLALDYFDKSLQVFSENNNQHGRASVQISRGSKMIEQEKYEAALQDYLNALDIVTQTGHKDRIATAKSALGKIYYYLNDYPKAIQYGQEAAQLSEEIGFPLEAAQTYGLLSDIYAETKQYQQAYKYLTLQKAVNDSLLNEKSLEITSELEAKYQNQQKETALTQQKLELVRQKNIRTRIAIACLVLLLGLLLAGGWIYRYRKQKQLTDVALQAKNKEAQQLKEMDQLKSNFFANISHEFRTPLTLIISPLEQLLAKEDSKLFKTMLRNGRRLLHLVNELLDLSKLESGKMQLHPQTIDFAHWVRPLAYSFESLAIRKQIDYQVILPSEPLICHFDPEKIEKILNNLLSNAFKFTPEEGQIKFTIEKGDNNNILVKVADSGIGIPASAQDHIFDRFYQVDQSANPAIGGTGIGLALTKELVKLHEGTIEVTSQMDKGTSFSLMLPILSSAGTVTTIATNPPIRQPTNLPTVMQNSEPSTVGPQPHPHIEPSNHQTIKSSPPLALIVEDNADLRSYIRSCLEEHWTIEEAINGAAGLEKAIQLIPEVIITDVMMPEMDGHELTKALRENVQTSHIPIIMLTAKAYVEDRIEGFEHGADDYLTKPFDARELVVRTQNLITQRKRLQEKYAAGLPDFLQKKENASNPEEKFLLRLVDVVKHHMEDEDFGVEELSKQMHLSRFQLHRKVKALTGKSISVFIRSIRLAHARQLLEAKSGNVSEIAFQLGFNSIAYFSKCFTEEFGFPPSKLL